MYEVTTEQYTTRLAAMCIKGVGQGLPKKVRDRHILFKSIKATLGTDREYSETELNEAIERWLATVGIGIVIDHVSLRRHLVDEGYVVRDRAGTTYRVARSRHEDLFEGAIDRLDQAKIIADALDRRQAKRREHVAGRGGA